MTELHVIPDKRSTWRVCEGDAQTALSEHTNAAEAELAAQTVPETESQTGSWSTTVTTALPTSPCRPRCRHASSAPANANWPRPRTRPPAHPHDSEPLIGWEPAHRPATPRMRRLLAVSEQPGQSASRHSVRTRSPAARATLSAEARI